MVCAGAFWGRGFSAQISIEDAIMTDSVDIFSEPGVKTGKSPAIAMVSSLLLPGSGHHYIERNRSALAYFSVEAAALFSFFMCDHYSKKIAQDAAGYAWTHSGAQGSISGPDDYYWKKVGKYMDAQDYNSAVDLDRLPAKNKITSENQYWHWDGEASKDRFNSILSTSRLFHVVSSFCIGALVLDRIIAFIDVRNIIRNSGTKQTGNPSRSISILPPRLSISSSTIDIQISGAF
jgi:hypothetical protein